MLSLADRVYQKLRQVPAGRVTTYKDLAHSLGTRAYRAVGQALRYNPFAPEVPCHRVVKSDGRIGGFMGQMTGGAVVKKNGLLVKEGVVVVNGRVRELEKLKWEW